MFEVFDDEDDDFPPARRDRGNVHRRPPRRERRKSSGSKNTIIGLSIGGGVLLLSLVIVLLVAILGDSPESLMKDFLACEEERLRILESMTNESSVEAGLPRLIENNTRMAGVFRRMADTPVRRDQIDTPESRKFAGQLREIEHRQRMEKDRIGDIRGGGKILSEVDRDGWQKLSAIKIDPKFRNANPFH